MKAVFPRMLLILAFSGIVSAVAGPVLAQGLPFHSIVPWQRITDDLEIAYVGIGTGSPLDGQIAFVRSGTKRFQISVIRAAQFGWQRATVRSLCRAARASVCVNANFFDEAGDPLGLVVSRGIEYRKVHKGGKTLTGVFKVTRQELAIVNRSDYTPAKVIEAVQAGPRLIANGQRIEGVKDTRGSRRAGVCIDREGKLILFSSATALSGITLDALQTILLAEPVNCVDALNLDGGGSAQLYVSDTIRQAPNGEEINVAGGDEVPVALALLPAFDRIS